MEQIVIKQIRETSAEFPQVWQLREEILRKPLGLSLKNEDLSDDKQDDIFIAIEGDKVIGCVMMHPLDNKVIKLRQMAVDEDKQGKGIGKLLVQAAENFAWENDYDKIKLHARQHAQGFYTGMGYSTIGDIFIEVSIPHVAMEKSKPLQ